MSTHNVCFHSEIRKNINTVSLGDKSTLPRAMYVPYRVLDKYCDCTNVCSVLTQVLKVPTKLILAKPVVNAVSDQCLHCLPCKTHPKLPGPRHAKMCLPAYLDSKGPDQPAQPHSLIRAFTVRKQNHWIRKIGPDETLPMCKMM